MVVKIYNNDCQCFVFNKKKKKTKKKKIKGWVIGLIFASENHLHLWISK